MSITVSTDLATVTCPSCSGIFAITQGYIDEAHRKGRFIQTWACPYCKATRGYGQSEADRLKTQIAELEKVKRFREEEIKRALDRADAAQKEAEHFRKSRDGIKGVLAKERKRVGNGVCPCCNRSFTFSALERHLKTKHPGYAKGVIDTQPQS